MLITRKIAICLSQLVILQQLAFCVMTDVDIENICSAGNLANVDSNNKLGTEEIDHDASDKYFANVDTVCNMESDTHKRFDKTALALNSATVQVCEKSGVRTIKKKIFVDEPFEFGDLKIMIKKCFRSAPDQNLCISAFVNVYEKRVDRYNSECSYDLIFSGWMFSLSQSVNSLEHPRYYIKIENVL